tara:strand:+ start:554 stop:850 length:297 start_codon:yes stop_codon:yes gene_type:complete
MARLKKKPTIKEIANSILFLKAELDDVKRYLADMEKALSLYIDMKKDTKKFSKFVDETIKKWKEANDSKANGKADKPNLQGDTDGESSGSEGIRKKDK